MKVLIYILLGCWVFIPLNYTAEKYALSVITENLKNSKGSVVFLLYNTEGSLPDEKLTRYFRKKTTAIDGNRAKITFKNLPKAQYAVMVFHDENKNGEIDRKFMLPLPKEGVGFSNYDDFGLSNRPNFKDASFSLNKDKTVVVKVIYK